MQHCDKCGNKTALVSGTYYFSADSEPYESGEELDIDLEKDEYLHAQYCETCESLSEVWCDENPMTGAQPNTDLITTEICVLRERVAELEELLEDISSNYKLGDKPSWKQLSEIYTKTKALINKGK